MNVDRERFLKDGYLILRGMIPPKLLDELRTSYETLLDRQKAIWIRDRKPEDPPGGLWETSMQPRVNIGLTPEIMDEQTANAVEFWLHENTLGVNRELLADPNVPSSGMLMMCNPATDRGPSYWHRDIRPIDTAPLQALLNDLQENGPRFVQWNIPLYDDDVLWVVPGSHLRVNNDDEERQLFADSKVPLPGGIQTDLKAGDGVVYISYMLHWGSNYSSKLRRTLHGGFNKFAGFSDLSFTKFLKPESRAIFERWNRYSEQLRNDTEAALRAVLQRDADAYLAALKRLRPGQGEKGRRLLTIYMCKAAYLIHLHKNPNLEGVHQWWKYAEAKPNPSSLNWGPEFSKRFTTEESDALWEAFQGMDAMLQADEEQFHPGFISEPMLYRYIEIPKELTVENFIAGWGELVGK